MSGYIFFIMENSKKMEKLKIDSCFKTFSSNRVLKLALFFGRIIIL